MVAERCHYAYSMRVFFSPALYFQPLPLLNECNSLGANDSCHSYNLHVLADKQTTPRYHSSWLYLRSVLHGALADEFTSASLTVPNLCFVVCPDLSVNCSFRNHLFFLCECSVMLRGRASCVAAVAVTNKIVGNLPFSSLPTVHRQQEKAYCARLFFVLPT